MRILVFGATGYVGGHAARWLAGAGHDVTVIVRREDAAEAFRAEGMAAIIGDARVLTYSPEFFAPFDGVLISGDLGPAIGLPVQRGQALMTVAPAQGWRIVAEVDSIKMVLSLVARNVGCSVVPASAIKTWPAPEPVYKAQVVHPVIRNRIVLATPAARPSNRLVKAVNTIIKQLVKQHF